jgi:Carboxypeptidase regulatory-like domain
MAHPTPNGMSAHTADGESPEPRQMPATAMLVIAVRSADGEAISGAAVCVIEPSGNQVAAARSSSGREARLAVPLGRLLVAVTAPGHAPKAAVLEVPAAGVELNVTLYPESELRGTVRNSGTPVPNALVTLLDEGGVVVTHVRSDASGLYRMAVPDEGTFTLIAVAPGTAPAVRTVRRPHDPAVCDLSLGAVARVHGVVRTPSGQPVAAAPVRLLGADGSAVHEQLTAADGSFEFRGLVDGHYSVSTEGYPAVSQMLTVPDPGEAGRGELVADITLAPGA